MFPFNVRFCCLKCELRACKVVKDHIPMHPAVIWNSTAVLSLTENQILAFHKKHQWILGAGSLFRSRRGGGVVVSSDTAVSLQPVLTKMLLDPPYIHTYFSFTYHGNYVKFTPITRLLAGSCILYLHIIVWYFDLQLHVQFALEVCVSYCACNGLVTDSFEIHIFSEKYET